MKNFEKFWAFWSLPKPKITIFFVMLCATWVFSLKTPFLILPGKSRQLNCVFLGVLHWKILFICAKNAFTIFQVLRNKIFHYFLLVKKHYGLSFVFNYNRKTNFTSFYGHWCFLWQYCFAHWNFFVQRELTQFNLIFYGTPIVFNLWGFVW